MAAGPAMPEPVIKAKDSKHIIVDDYYTVVAVRDCNTVDGEEPELGAVLSK
jgi:hypothetical protein